MANRCLLHKNKLEKFKQWLELDGWEIQDNKDLFEVIRARKDGRYLIVYRRLDASEHYSIKDVDASIVRRFLKEISHGGKYGKLFKRGARNNG